jgi:hypothetical protein
MMVPPIFRENDELADILGWLWEEIDCLARPNIIHLKCHTNGPKQPEVLRAGKGRFEHSF